MLEAIKQHVEELFPELECFVGDENLYLHHQFWTFLHPYETELRLTFERVVESGIYKLMNEIYEFRNLERHTKQFRSDGQQNVNDIGQSATLFSMHNPQASVIFMALSFLEGISFLILILEWITSFLVVVYV